MFRHLALSTLDLIFPPRCILCRRASVSDARFSVSAERGAAVGVTDGTEVLETVSGKAGLFAQPSSRAYPGDSRTISTKNLTLAGLLCPTCEDRLLREMAQPACRRCGCVFEATEAHGERCSHCAAKRLQVSGTACLGPYRDALGVALRAYKFSNLLAWEPLFCRWLAEAITAAPWRRELDSLAAVPTHWRRRWSRRYYPAEAIARRLSRALRLPCVPLLRRIRAGHHQIGLSYTKRLENVRGAFAPSPGVTMHDATILLVDDVKTTGATLDECARVLLRAGAKRVYAGVLLAAVGIGPGDPIPSHM